MKYSYEYKRMCVEMYREGKWPETPEGIQEENINYEYARNMVRLKPVGLGTNIFAIICFGVKIILNISVFSWDEQGAFSLCVVIYQFIVFVSSPMHQQFRC